MDGGGGDTANTKTAVLSMPLSTSVTPYCNSFSEKVESKSSLVELCSGGSGGIR